MPTYRKVTDLPFSREDVTEWLARPGALTRLFPPFAGRVVAEPEGIDVGAQARLKVFPPGRLGLGLTSAYGLARTLLPLPVPGFLAPEVGWLARHSAYDPGEVMADEAIAGPFSFWLHSREFTDVRAEEAGGAAGTSEAPLSRMVDNVEYELPLPARPAGSQLESVMTAEFVRQFGFRERQLLGDLAFHRAHGRLPSQLRAAGGAGAEPPLTVAVTGASGMIGTQVCALLGGAGCRVVRLVRRPVHGPDEIFWDPYGGELDVEALREVDVVVNLAGHPLAGRFTVQHKRAVISSRVLGTRLIAARLAELSGDGRLRSLINGSAIGYYGATPGAQHPQSADRRLRESDPRGEGFLAEVCAAWESETRPASQAGVRVAMPRVGIVQSPAGGALQQLLPLMVAGVGGPLGSTQTQSWISLDDVAALIVHLVLEAGAEGPVNAVAPEPVSAREHARTLGQVLRRPAAIPVPAFGPQALLGREGSREIVQADQDVSAERAGELGYDFRHRDLETALRHMLGY